jgi:hypothetical protein
MATPQEDRAWGRIQNGALKGGLIGASLGAIVGLVVGAIVFRNVGPIVMSVLVGGIGLGVLGAFWGILSKLESPDPGQEPTQVDRPLTVSELTAEERNRPASG